MFPEYIDLRIVPLASILLQEAVTGKKANRLAKKIKQRGKIMNPVVVAPFDEDRFVQLDGASRAAALLILEAPWAFAHVVNYNDVRLTSWGHVTVLKTKKLNRIDNIAGEDVLLTKKLGAESSERELVATIYSQQGEITEVHTRADLLSRLHVATALFTLYKQKPEIRVDVDDGNITYGLRVAEKLGERGVLIKYRDFSSDEVMNVVRQGYIMPPGLTKHHLKARVLQRLPLKWLLEKNATQEELQARLVRRCSKFRYHPYRDTVIYEAEQWK